MRVPDPVEVEYIREAAARIIRGDKTASVCRWLTAEKQIVPKTKKPFTHTTLNAMLLSESRMTFLDPATALELRSVLLDPARRTGKGVPKKNLLSGLMVCRCGATVHATGRSDGTAYRCSDGSNRETAPHGTVRQVLADDYVLDALADRLEEGDALALLGRSRDPAAGAARARAAATLQQIEAEEASARELLAEGLLSASQFRDVHARLAARRRDAEAKVLDVGSSDEAAAAAVVLKLNVLFDAGRGLADATDEERRVLLRAVFAEIRLEAVSVKGQRLALDERVTLVTRSGERAVRKL
jgi:hypothetical protein